MEMELVIFWAVLFVQEKNDQSKNAQSGSKKKP